MQQSEPARALRERQPPVAALTLPLLTPADTHLAPVPTQFLSLVSDHLGNLGTSTDGFDQVLADPWNALEADSTNVSTIAVHTQDADFTDGDFNTAIVDPISLDIQSFNETGELANDSFTTAAHRAITSAEATDNSEASAAAGDVAKDPLGVHLTAFDDWLIDMGHLGILFP